MDNPIKAIINDKPTPNWREVIWALISYLGVFVLLPLILHLKSEFVVHHRKQGMALFCIEIFSVFIFLIPFVGWLVGLIGWLFSVVLSIIGVINVLQKKYWSVPFLIKISDKIKL